MIVCKECQGPTNARQVSKGPNGPWTAHECAGSCRTPDGKYKLTTSPPRDDQGGYVDPPPGRVTTTKNPNEAIEILKAIDYKLARMCQMLAVKLDPIEKVDLSDEAVDLEVGGD